MRGATIAAVLLLAAGLVAQLRGGSADKMAIVNSRHDFRVTSAATVKAAQNFPDAGEQLCIFCHTPHNSNPGTELWNQTMGTRDFATYTSSTLQSTVPPVTSSDPSKLCLSCHDGTIALGDTVRNGQIVFVAGYENGLPANSPSNLAGYSGYGFSDDHPFAFAPNLANPQMQPPPTGDPVKMISGKIQCTTCHEPHNENQDATMGMFLVKNNRGSAMCMTCHRPTGWLGSAHQSPPDPVQDARYTGNQGAHTGYIGVANNGCESCHKPHSPQVGQRLVKFPEESVCFQCHDGTVTTLNIKNEFGKQYKHPVMLTPSVHDESESPNSAQYQLPENAPGTPRHAECQDCHNSHAAQATPVGYAPQAPRVTPPLRGVRGQSSANTFLPQAANEYEICFKCHADSANKPQSTDSGTGGIGFGRNARRQYDLGSPTAYNLRIAFANGISSHPVTMPGSVPSTQVPSLRQFMTSKGGSNISSRPLSMNSSIYCSDCHNNDTGIQTIDGGTGPSGVHASNFPHLLERSDVMEPAPGVPGAASSGLGAYSQDNFRLCDKCHDLTVVTGATSSFPLHGEHLQMAGAACSTCHSPHASGTQMLVNFDTTVVGGTPSWTRTAPGQGTCTLVCHGVNHTAFPYPPPPGWTMPANASATMPATALVKSH
ncbi:MAG TPA: cytochrome c3 family protein [Terriglobales bacterium]|nr:cytochrome c3 family protein [Terriglobales bacterium]